MIVRNVEDFKKTIEMLVPGDYSLGVHGITGDSESYTDVASGIMKNGLKINGWGGILSNTEMYSELNNITDRQMRKIYDYCFQLDNNDQCVNVLVAVPKVIQDTSSKEYFLGHYNYSSTYQKGDDKSGAHLPFTMYTEDIGYVPKEFIVGYYYSTADGDVTFFLPNKDFMGIKSEKEKKEYFEKLLNNGLNNHALEVVPGSDLSQFGESEYIRQYQEYVDSIKQEKGL